MCRCPVSGQRRGVSDSVSRMSRLSGSRLESVLERKLHGAVVAVRTGDLAEVAVGHAAVWCGVVGDVEGVEEIGTELHAVFAPDREALEHGHVNVLEAGLAERPGPNGAEGVVGLLGKDAASVVLIGPAGRTLHGRSPVSVDGAVDNFQRT